MLNASGKIVRYGQFYGPGTYYPDTPTSPSIQIDGAAARKLEALTTDMSVPTIIEE